MTTGEICGILARAFDDIHILTSQYARRLLTRVKLVIPHVTIRTGQSGALSGRNVAVMDETGHIGWC